MTFCIYKKYLAILNNFASGPFCIILQPAINLYNNGKKGPKMCVSVRWVTLWVRPPLLTYVCPFVGLRFVGASPPVCPFKVRKCVCPFVGLHCGCVPPCENMCVRSLGYIVGASPPCVSRASCIRHHPSCICHDI